MPLGLEMVKQILSHARTTLAIFSEITFIVIPSGTFFFSWDALHARRNSHCKAWNYKEKKHKKIKAHEKCFERTYS